MNKEVYIEVLEWAEKNSFPVKEELERQVRKLLFPSPLESLKDLKQTLKPRPPYLGPGIWLRAIGDYRKGEEHA
ncbi:MAG: hypothetical protein Kow009_06120 [Spirochaetales bacterium]